MLDEKGNLLTSTKAVKNRAIVLFTQRLKSNDIEANLNNLEEDTIKLCEARLKMSKQNKSKTGDMDYLKHVLNKLGRGGVMNRLTVALVYFYPFTYRLLICGS